MKITTLGYSVKQGFQNLKRNKLFSLASIGTIAVCIFLLCMFYAILSNIQFAVKNAEKNLLVTVFFDKGIEKEEIDNIGELIEKRVEVSRIVFKSEEEAWNEFKKNFDDPTLAEGFKDDNPLADSASYSIYLNDASMQPHLVAYLETVKGIRKVNSSKLVANIFTNIGKIVGYTSMAIIIILLGVAIFLISNTVMVGIAVRKEEIGIMKLIGATDYFVRAPFIVEGIITGLVGAIIPLAIIYYLYGNIVAKLFSREGGLGVTVDFLEIGDIFQVIMPMALIIGAGIGFIGSMITIRKHLKV